MLPQPPCKQNGKLCSRHSLHCKASCAEYKQYEKIFKEQKEMLQAHKRKISMTNEDARYRHAKMTGRKLNAR